MKLVFTSYSSSNSYNEPASWLERIDGYTGILETLGVHHSVMGIERINYEGRCRQNGVDYYFIRLKKKVVRFPWRMHQLIKNLRPDVVFINGIIFPLQVIQLRFKLGKKVKIIILHRAEKPFTGLKKIIQQAADKCIDAYLFTSTEFEKEWKKNIRASKIQEIIQASSGFHALVKSNPGEIPIRNKPVFLWVGNLIPRKDPLTVLKAFLQFLDQNPDAKLYMIYQSGELLNTVTDLIKGKEAVQLVGKVAHAALQDWYQRADFIISGSHHEGSGVAISEAMSCGCIPLVTDIISFRRMTGPGKCGLLYEPGNEKALLAILKKTEEMEIEKEREKTLQQFRQELSFEAIAQKIEELIAIPGKI